MSPADDTPRRRATDDLRVSARMRSIVDVIGRNTLIVITVANLLLVLYVALTYARAAEYRDQLTALQTTIAGEVAQAKIQHDRFTAQIAELERIVYGQITPDLADKSRPITSAEAWQRNRDRELRDRIAALERWRLAHTD